jgi:phosphinothricin acetyltransferase
MDIGGAVDMTIETDVTVMRAVRTDVQKILELSNWAADNLIANFATEPESLSAWMEAWEKTNATHPWLVAKRHEDLLGFAKASPHRARGAYAWVAEVSVYVQPGLHGRRVGTDLYRRLIPLMREQGYATLLAGIASPNPPSERLHAAFGFNRCGTFHRVGWKFGRWHDVGYWELRLRDDDIAPEAIRPVGEVWDHTS